MSKQNQNEPVPQLNGFTFEKRLGTGTYASVYKASLKNNVEAPFAIKCIKKSSLNKASTENLLREIKILKNIKHEYIVQLKDFQWDENYIYLIMEYCPGGDLSAFIKSRRTIPEKYVRRFVQQIACALKHLHLKGIAHMDLKPQNILLTSVNNPSLKLADFGFAQYMRGDNVSMSLRGSPLYMAPEILKHKMYDSKVDLWSVGVILHEVIFGYAPFVSNSLDELQEKIMDDTPIEIPTHIMLSETCKDLLTRLLQRNPADRITFWEFFNHPFVDLDHMSSSQCLPKATELLSKAVRFDQRGDYLLAQKYYLQSIEYLIPAIQYEKEANKKQEIREKANIYLKRAEEIAELINPTASKLDQPMNKLSLVDDRKTNSSRTFAILQRTNSTEKESTTSTSPASPSIAIPINFELRSSSKPYQNQTEQATGTSGGASGAQTSSTTAAKNNSLNNHQQSFSSFTMVSSLDPQKSQFMSSMSSSVNTPPLSPFDLLKLTENNLNVNYAIRSCLEADEKLKDSNLSDHLELCDQYQDAIAILLPYLKELPKDEFAKGLKQNISKWLTNAERLKTEQRVKTDPKVQGEKLKMLKARDSFKEEDDENSPYYKHCIIS